MYSLLHEVGLVDRHDRRQVEPVPARLSISWSSTMSSRITMSALMYPYSFIMPTTSSSSIVDWCAVKLTTTPPRFFLATTMSGGLWLSLRFAVFKLLDQHLDVGLEDVDHQEYHVGRTDDGQDLAPPPLALGGVLDQPGQVQDLYLGAPVLHESRDAREGGELVGGDLARRIGDLVQKGGLADARETHERHGPVARLLDRVARGLGPLGPPDLGLVPQPGHLGLQLANVVLGVLVVLGLAELVLDLSDLLFNVGHRWSGLNAVPVDMCSSTLRQGVDDLVLRRDDDLLAAAL